MATSYKRTSIKTFPRIGEKITRDTLYWKNLEFPVTRKEFGAISYIDFSPVQPYNFAATSSTKIQTFSSENCQLLKNFARFRDGACSGSYRSDGKLLVTGSEEAAIKLFDASSKALLRVFKGHTRPVKVARFTGDNVHILSGSDDNSVRLWDIPSETEFIQYNEHEDYVRCGVVSKASKDIVLTGSYDHTVRLFDTRGPSSVLSVDHGHPVESVLMYPAGGIFLSAGGNVIKAWDALAGGRLLASFSNHHKTITCMSFASNYQRLLSGGLDRLVKVYDVGTYQVVHTLDYPSAILSIGVAGDDSMLAVGMADGLLSMQHRKSEDDINEKSRMKKKASYKYILQGKTHVAAKGDDVVEHKRKTQLAKYDRFFKKFEYTKALDAALDVRLRTRSPEVTVSILQELIRRGGIRPALAGRDEKSLTIIIKFIQRNISNPKFTSILMDITNMILDIYSEQIGQTAPIDELLLRLKETVDQEADYMKQLMEVMGTMDTLFAASQRSEVTTSTNHNTDILQPSVPASADVKS